MTDELVRPEPPTSLPPEKLRWTCDPESLGYRTTSELEPVEGIIGQDRAMKAITLGLEMNSPGYNVFVSGFVGTGRNTAIRRVLEKLDGGESAPDDLLFVHNFDDEDRPKAIFVPAGKGSLLVQRMKRLVTRLEKDVPKVLESDVFIKRYRAIQERFESRQQKMLLEFQEEVRKEGFDVVQVQKGPIAGPEVAPVVDGEPKFLSDLEDAAEAGEFDQEKLKALAEKQKELTERLQDVIRAAVRVDADMNARFEDLMVEVVRPIVTACFWQAREGFGEIPTVIEYLRGAEKHALANLDRFREVEESEEEGATHPTEDDLDEFKVNLVVDNRTTTGSPIVMENSPTVSSLFGVIQRAWGQNGREPVSHMNIKGGSLVEANGGYLVLNAADLFNEPPVVWNNLKRTLRTGRLEFPSADTSTVLGPPALKPEPVDLSLKVVLIGESHLYSFLYSYDEDFRTIFKVRADFDTEMENVPENVKLFGRFLQRLTADEKSLPFEATGVAHVVEHASRLAGRQDKLSTRFNLIADLARESSYFASRNGSETINAEHVQRAIEAKDDRNSLAQEKMEEMITDDSIFIDVEGTRVGELNGLAVYESGEHAFGIPSKITATVSMGNAGIINIEREAELSGRTHDKGVQILSGYLRSKFAQEKPLTLSASICFEQSYSGVDGDSASSTEIYAILSALSGLPLRQDIAVTGSMNQAGEIQAIGGTNEKIEGFFNICRAKGLTGTQGVIIPRANLTDLMLNRDVKKAVEDGRFHVYAIESIDEGLEILTGVAAGKRVGKRRFPMGTVNGRVDSRLRKLANQMRDYGGQS